MTTANNARGDESVPQRRVESVRFSPDGNALLIFLAVDDPEVVGFARAGGLGDDQIAGTKRFLSSASWLARVRA